MCRLPGASPCLELWLRREPDLNPHGPAFDVRQIERNAGVKPSAVSALVHQPAERARAQVGFGDPPRLVAHEHPAVAGQDLVQLAPPPLGVVPGTPHILPLNVWLPLPSSAKLELSKYKPITLSGARQTLLGSDLAT